jgi:hypothetical protein
MSATCFIEFFQLTAGRYGCSWCKEASSHANNHASRRKERITMEGSEHPKNNSSASTDAFNPNIPKSEEFPIVSTSRFAARWLRLSCSGRQVLPPWRLNLPELATFQFTDRSRADERKLDEALACLVTSPALLGARMVAQQSVGKPNNSLLPQVVCLASDEIPCATERMETELWD